MTDENDKAIEQQVRDAWGKFVSMASTYSLGVFNDNFFKQAAMLMDKAVAGRVMFIFTVPYLLFSAYAGWMADRFPKRRIVIAAKILEMFAMVCGAVGICTGNWSLIMAMAFTMGLQSAIFGPALNGSIPELYPESYVLKANAYLKMAVTASILAGVALAGIALDIGKSAEAGGEGLLWFGFPSGQVVVAAAVLTVASLGVVMSLGVVRRPAADPRAKFPWGGPINTLGELLRIRRDGLLSVAIGADVFVWSAGATLIVLINYMGGKQFGFSDTKTSLILASELVGIAVGGGLSSKLAKGKGWHRVLAPSCLAMGVLMGLVAAVPYLPEAAQTAALCILLGGVGVAGGLYMIPCESFIQVRPAPEKKGATIAASNFAVFTGIMISGPIVDFLNEHVLPTNSIAMVGALAAVVAVVLFVVIPRVREA